jgi:hypothetical protein
LPLKWWAQCHLFDLTGRSFTLAAFFRCTFQSFPAFIAAVARGLAAAYVKDLNVFFTSLFNVLPTLVLLLGGAYCAVYRRQRELFLMVTVYIAYFLLDTQTDYYRDNGKVREDAAVVFHLCCLLLPCCSAYSPPGRSVPTCSRTWSRASPCCWPWAAWRWRWSKVTPGAADLAGGDPLAGAAWAWMSLIQLSYPVFIGSFLLLVQYWRNRARCTPRNWWACSDVLDAAETFILPFTLNIMCSQVMLMIAAAVAHEAYQMAFRDELTGLPGRRALNERMQRLGRNYVLAMSDVDHFKKFNDTHGHDVGDQVLRLVASKLSKITGVARPIAMAVRSSPWCSPARPSRSACRTWRHPRIIANYNIQLRNQDNRPQDDSRVASAAGSNASSVSVTISIGVAERIEHRTPKKCSNPPTRRCTAPRAPGVTASWRSVRPSWRGAHGRCG